MNQIQVQEFKQAQQEFAAAAEKLLAAWPEDAEFVAAYPFDSCFSEVSHSIRTWANVPVPPPAKRRISMPWQLVMDDNPLDSVAYIGYVEDGCECSSGDEGPCHPSSPMLLFGTSDSHDPKFCAIHYFLHNQSDGKGDYKLVPDAELVVP